MIIKLIGWLPVIAAFVAVDWYLIERRKIEINHLVEFILRAGCAIIYGGLVFDAQPGWHGFHVISFEALSFWVLFEPALNLARRKRWDYLGTMAATDRFFRENWATYYMLKLAAVGVLIVNIHYLITHNG
jgi:hypothetical protein